MALHVQERDHIKSALFDPPDQEQESPERVQFKRGLGALTYADQVEAVKPAPPVDTVQTLHEGPVQQKGGGENSEQIKAAAASGIQGQATSLPHLDRIQTAFGGHDLSGVKSYAGGAAADANQAMGSSAYATGNAVAFKSSPDLHTAAHEAAHVVQQRAGVSLANGVGQVGDSYEKHADAVADRVVGGQTAVDLLGSQSGGGSGVQMRASTEGRQDTAINEDYFAEACRREGIPPAEVEAWKNELLKGKPPEKQFVSVEDAVGFLYKLSTRDNYFNSKIKVAFETKLGQALNEDRAACEPILKKVLSFCNSYLLNKTDGNMVKLKAEFEKMKPMFGGVKPHEVDLYYGRILDTLDGNEVKFYTEMRKLFQGQGSFSISQQCLAIQRFHNDIYEVDFNDSDEGQLAHYLRNLNTRALDPGEVRWGLKAGMTGDKDSETSTAATDIFGSDSSGGKVEGAEGASRRGRYRADKKAGSSRTESRGLGARGRATSSSPRGDIHQTERAKGDQVQEHGRGIDNWTMDERQAFIQQARMLDMPLAGSVSGTTSDLITIAIMAGVSSDAEKFQFICCCLDHFIGAGAHTFHEVLTAATATEFGIRYTPGDYYGFFEQYIKSGSNMPATKALFDKARGGKGPYKSVKGIGRPL